MILLMRNHVDEFVPGHDYTAVRLDATLAGLNARRAVACRASRLAEDSLAEARYWDASPICVGSPDPDMEGSIEQALHRGDGWAVLEDGALGAYEPARADCTQMVISVGESPSVAWSYRVGSEPVRTADVPLRDLFRRLGSPHGDPLKVVT